MYDLINWEELTETTLSNGEAIALYLVNDRINGITSIYFSSESITTLVGCAQLDDEF